MKKELATELARKYGIPVRKMYWLVDDFFEMIEEAIVENDRVTVHGFGSFRKGSRGAATIPDLQKGGSINIPPRITLHFKPSKQLKEKINAKD